MITFYLNKRASKLHIIISIVQIQHEKLRIIKFIIVYNPLSSAEWILNYWLGKIEIYSIMLESILILILQALHTKIKIIV